MINPFTFVSFCRIHFKYSIPLARNQDSIADDLRQNGFVLLKNQLDRKICLDLFGFLKDHFKTSLSFADFSSVGNYASDFYKASNYISFPNAGVFRFDAIDQLDFFSHGQSISDILDNLDFRDIFEEYLSDNESYLVKRSLSRYEVAYGINTESIADTWHFDHYMPRLKSFLYLNDVDDTNSPFQYLRGSNRTRSMSRLLREYKRYKGGHRKGYLSATEFEDVASAEDLKPIFVYPDAGDVLLVDTRGIHRRTIPKGGERVTLNSFYEIQG